MIGVLAGDVIGSVHEHALTKSTAFRLFDPLCRFTDDTVLTVATAHAILTRTSYEAAQWDVSCQRSVPEAIVAFLDSSNVADTIRLAVSLGGDADTQAAIVGGIAEAFYRHLPETIVDAVRERLPPRFIEVVDAFRQAFPLDTKC